MKLSTPELHRRYKGVSAIKPIDGKYIDFDLYKVASENNIDLKTLAKEVGISYKHLRSIANIQKFTSVFRIKLIENCLIDKYHIDIDKYRFPKDIRDDKEPQEQQTLDIFDMNSDGECGDKNCKFNREGGCCISCFFSKMNSKIDGIEDAMKDVAIALGQVLGAVSAMTKNDYENNVISSFTNHIKAQSNPIDYVSSLLDKVKDIETSIDKKAGKNVGKKG